MSTEPHTALYVRSAVPLVMVPMEDYGRIRVTCRPRLWPLIRRLIALDARMR